jgi:hypothetical protein
MSACEAHGRPAPAVVIARLDRATPYTASPMLHLEQLRLLGRRMRGDDMLHFGAIYFPFHPESI